MPYDGEFASYGPLSRILQNPKVRDVISRCQPSTADTRSRAPLVAAAEGPSAFLPDLVLAVDGSYQQVPVNNGYPAAELACLTTAAVLIDVRRQRELDAHRPVNPRDYRLTQGTTSLDCALPGCNVVLDEPTPKASFRRALYESSSEVASLDSGETLLQTYEVLLAYRPTTRAPACPCGEGCADPDANGDARRFNPRTGITTCPCSASRPVFSTDALRIHEGFIETGPAGAMFAEAMQVWERLWVVNFLRNLEAQGMLGNHRPLGIVLDGPLAVFGHPAWLSQAIYRELKRLNGVACASGHDLLLIGVEKSGAFVDHFAALDTPRGQTGTSQITSQTAYLLSDRYIRDHIVLSDGKTYGLDTYFGRKFFYKTVAGQRVVGTLPFLSDEDRDLNRTEVARFPRLTDAMALLDAMFSVRYPNAVGPLVAAHAEAAIPLNAGRRAFDQLVSHLRR